MVQVSPGTEIAAMLAGQADVAIAYQPGVAQAEAAGAHIVFDFANPIGPFCNTGIMVLNTTVTADPTIVQALCDGFQKAMKRTYGDPTYAKQVARAEFPELAPDIINSAIDTELRYRIPSDTVVVDRKQWANLIAMQVYLGNIRGTTSFEQIVDNSFALEAAA